MRASWHICCVATQAERTAKMRARLLRATVRCLVQLGYTGTSTTEVCRRAKVSRGAQLHHFPTKAELVAAAVEQVFVDRINEFQKLVERMAQAPSLELASFIDPLWDVYRGDPFYAWLELLVAARTDPSLRRHVHRVDVVFTERAEAVCTLVLGSRLREPGDARAVTRLILATLDGLGSHSIVEPNKRLPHEVLAVLARLGTRPVV